MHHQQRWTLTKIRQRLDLIEPLVYFRHITLPAFRYQELPGPETPPPVGLDINDRTWREIHPHEYWGRWQTDFVLRTVFSIPKDWDTSMPTALYLPLGEAEDFSHPEALAYIDGAAYAATDRHHQEILLRPEWADGREHLLALHGWTGLGDFPDADPYTRLLMRSCLLAQIHQPTREFIRLARVALETAELLESRDPARHGLLNALDAAFLALDTHHPLGREAFYDSLPEAAAQFKAGLQAAGAPLDVIFHAIGHAHIDVAWLWTLAQTRRKAERTFHTVIRLMEQFPDYRFSQSQPQLYEFIRQDQPALFEAIKARIAEGRWEPMGGMWVEADCNLSGAEALARQFLLGRSYFRRHFGPDAETPVLWLPDVFGYTWSLPQLIRQAGLKYFMTIKIGWSQYNRLPYDTFLWQGIDGTRVPTHFSTVKETGSMYASTYNSKANPRETLGSWENFQQKELHRHLLMAYGYGDGGGGPTREMLENIEVMGSMPGLPQVRQSSVQAFFEQLEPLADSRMMPVWNGELYLEYHRGTYTTQARTKRANRKSEFLLHDAEFLAAQAALLDPAYRYPAEALGRAWQTVCLNQFHDIIPGSSIGAVYAEAEAQYAALEEEVGARRDEALAVIAANTGGAGLLANPTSFPQKGLVFVPGAPERRFARDGMTLPAQPAEGGVWIDPGELPAYSITPLAEVESETASAGEGSPHSSDFMLENDYLRVAFNPDGEISGLFDKRAARQVLPPGAAANQFQLFEDRPMMFEAWDIDIYYDDKMWLCEPAESIRWLESGPLRQTVEVVRRYQGSTITQQISLERGAPRIDFHTHVDWRERRTLLKVAFPVDVLATHATYEIQWGNVQRPTHRNTSWDWARFESVAHKWVDLSEGGYGVSLLNDCKYGHDIHDNVMRLTLLRSPMHPDPEADLGEHEFSYSLLPHAGGWDERTQTEAYRLNDPVIVYQPEDPRPPSPGSGLPSLISTDAPHVIIETIKMAEDGDGLIVRLYESQRQRGPVTLHAGFELAGAWVTNLLEENQSALQVEGRAVRLEITPFQIVTLRLRAV